MTLTLNQLRAIMPKIPLAKAEEYLEALLPALEDLNGADDRWSRYLQAREVLIEVKT